MKTFEEIEQERDRIFTLWDGEQVALSERERYALKAAQQALTWVIESNIMAPSRYCVLENLAALEELFG